MRPAWAQPVGFGSLLAALIALAAAPGAAAEPDRWTAGAAVEPLTGLGAAEGLGGALARLAQAQAPDPAASREDGAPPLKWLRYSSERFRTLMRMLAARSARTEAKRAAEEAKLAAEAKATEEAKRAAEAAEETKRAADAKAAEEAKRVTKAKAAEEAKRAAEAKAAEEAKRAAEAKAVEVAKRAAEAKAAEAKRATEAKAAEEAKRIAEAKAAEEARRAAEAKAAEEAKRVAEQASKTAEPTADIAKPAPAKRLATCRNAGVKAAGGGWYVVQVGDSLWSIARTHYGYGRAYGRIHAANRRTIANPARIYPCQRIYIPSGRLGEAPLQDLRVALAPFVRRRAIDGAVPWLSE